MYEIVNEPNLTIAFDMDTELSQFGVFGVYIKQGYNICAGYIDPSDWSGIHRGYKELVELYENLQRDSHLYLCVNWRRGYACILVRSKGCSNDGD